MQREEREGGKGRAKIEKVWDRRLEVPLIECLEYLFLSGKKSTEYVWMDLNNKVHENRKANV